MTAQLTVNGEAVALHEPMSVQDVVIHIVGDGSGGRGVAVAVNNEVVPRGSWASTTLCPGDQVEILTATQGG